MVRAYLLFPMLRILVDMVQAGSHSPDLSWAHYHSQQSEALRMGGVERHAPLSFSMYGHGVFFGKNWHARFVLLEEKEFAAPTVGAQCRQRAFD